MILIISNNDDWSTNDVVEWLKYYGANFERVNFDDTAKIFSYSFTKEDENTSFIDCNYLSVVWFRRTIKVNLKIDFYSLGPLMNRKLFEFLDLESKYFNRGVFHLINMKCKNRLNNFFSSFNDKIETLILAKKLGMEIPDFVVTQSKQIALKFIKDKQEKVITKPIYNIGTIRIKEKVFMPYTRMINENDFKEFPDNIFPIFLQEKIEKKIEIRAFYLNDAFYSMAIFSQSSSKTNVDFRKYDRVKPNRRVPFKLPVRIEENLKELMIKLDLNSGSVDLILTPNNDYYFLEVNPVGQFGMVSYPCNYFLEDKIANYLTQFEK